MCAVPEPSYWEQGERLIVLKTRVVYCNYVEFFLFYDTIISMIKNKTKSKIPSVEQLEQRFLSVASESGFRVMRNAETSIDLDKCISVDVARAVMYCVEQKYETGQAIPVTGGQVMLN